MSWNSLAASNTPAVILTLNSSAQCTETAVVANHNRRHVVFGGTVLAVSVQDQMRTGVCHPVCCFQNSLSGDRVAAGTDFGTCLLHRSVQQDRASDGPI